MDKSLDCVCVIHGDRYPWIYVERLWNMLCRHLTTQPRFHVFTESSRSVPEQLIRHDLQEWPGISNSRRAWWYKMQMFDPRHGLGTVLYLDLDVVVCGSLDWVQHLDHRRFWAIRDWRCLWRPGWRGINSSMMFWDTQKFSGIWSGFLALGLSQACGRYHGDQDFLTEIVDKSHLSYFPEQMIRSWRWQIRDGGMDPRSRQSLRPGAGSIIPPDTRVMVFHGRPKPHEVSDPVIQQHWI